MDFDLRVELDVSIFECRGGQFYMRDSFAELSPLSLTIVRGGEDIGFVRGYLTYNDSNFLRKCTDESSYCRAIAEAVCDDKGSISESIAEKQDDRVFILEDIYIEKEYRHRGLATQILKNLPTLLKQLYFNAGGTLLLSIRAYEAESAYGKNSPEHSAECNQLKKLFTSCGFAPVINRIMYRTTPRRR